MKNHRKLYSLTPSNFSLPFHTDFSHKVIGSPAHDIPTLKWPCGAACFEGNAYMLDLYDRGLSRKDDGGTLLTYATNISHYLRYCSMNGLNLANITDNEFCMFIKGLLGERKPREPSVAVRTANTVISIGRQCLDFLAFVGLLHHRPNLVGPDGVVKAERREYALPGRFLSRARNRSICKYWHHRSFPPPREKKRRLPICENDVIKLREAVHRVGGTSFRRMRRYVMLKLLEITGARRTEIASVTVESVILACAMLEPKLKLSTAKKRGGAEAYRYVPISSHDAQFLRGYIEKNRNPMLRLKFGRVHNDGYLIVSETTGRKLKPNTITIELRTLAAAAGITSRRIGPHLYRHRFITNALIELIKQHRLKNPGVVRAPLLDIEAMKKKIQEWTGQADVRSLDVYIDLALDQLDGVKVPFDLAMTNLAIKSAMGSLAILSQNCSENMAPAEALQQIQGFLEAFSTDLANCDGKFAAH
jgi:site-specific recombinase XerD